MSSSVESLQIQVAFLEHSLHEMNKVLHQFTDRVIALETEVRSLREQLEEEDLAGHEHEPPPHY